MSSKSIENIGEWIQGSQPSGSGVVCIHSAMLPNDKLLCIERPHTESGLYPENPNTEGQISAQISLNVTSQTVSSDFTGINLQENAFCSGQSIMYNGAVLVVGGDNGTAELRNGKVVEDGRYSIRVYTPCDLQDSNCTTGSWSLGEKMSSPRWYPTVTTLYNGDHIIVGGATIAQPNFTVPREYDNPTFEYFPPRSGEYPKHLNLLSWSFPYNLYPPTFQMPSGSVFIFASNKSILLDPISDEVTPIADMPSSLNSHRPWIYPFTPTSVILPMTIQNNWTFTVMLCGGTEKGPGLESASPRCAKWNAATDWTIEQDMPVGRLMGDSIILPDGTIFFTNGAGLGMAGGGYQGQCGAASNPVLTSVLYDPLASGKKWQVVAPAKNKRMYHSTALLTRTGEVVTMGSEMDNLDDYWTTDTAKRNRCWPVVNKICTSPFNYNIEKYSPPYIKKAALTGRLEIVEIEARVNYQAFFTIVVSAPNQDFNISRVNAIRRGSVTHSLNTDQRLVELKISEIVKSRNLLTLTIEAPINGALAPPGDYFLFIIDTFGVPSVGQTVRFSDGNTDKWIFKRSNQAISLSYSLGFSLGLLLLNVL